MAKKSEYVREYFCLHAQANGIATPYYAVYLPKKSLYPPSGGQPSIRGLTTVDYWGFKGSGFYLNLAAT